MSELTPYGYAERDWDYKIRQDRDPNSWAGQSSGTTAMKSHRLD